MAKIPHLRKDNTDRNRTSPFAFTGNKFEMRMAGSSMNCAGPMTILNTIVGVQLQKFRKEVDALLAKKMDQDSALLTVIRKYINEARPILFDGDGYSDDWKKEAKKRGLSNTPNTPEALKIYKTEKVEKFSLAEIDAHYAVMFENYSLKMDIESKTLADMCKNIVLPAAIAYQTKIASNIVTLKKTDITDQSFHSQHKLLKQLSKDIDELVDWNNRYIRHTNQILWRLRIITVTK